PARSRGPRASGFRRRHPRRAARPARRTVLGMEVNGHRAAATREGAVKLPSTATISSLLISIFADFEGGPAAAPGVRPVMPLAPPSLKSPPNESRVRLARMEVRVTVSGLESETVTTLTFSNPNPRQLAGDLEFQLPDGAAVAGYALDIGGRMVDGV